MKLKFDSSQTPKTSANLKQYDMMRGIIKLIVVCVAISFAYSCANNKKQPVNVLTAPALEGEWNILKVDGEKINIKPVPWIGFDIQRNQVYGNGGCNRFFGQLILDSIQYGMIFVKDMASTQIMCPNHKIELIILDAIDNMAFYKTDSDMPEQITVYSRDSTKILYLEKKKVDLPSLSELSGEWVIESAYGKKIEATAEVAPFIGFNTDESRIYGNVGCNTIDGVLEQDSAKANSIVFKNIATTNILCPSMETEKIILECLNAARSFKRTEDGEIILYNDKGDELLILKKE